MRYVVINDVRPGMILGRALYDITDTTLLTEGNALTGEIIEKLKQRGYPGVYIDDAWSRGIQIEEIISEELRRHAVQSLQELDVDATMDAARKIVEQILQSEAAFLELIDLRSYDNFIYRHSVNVAVLSAVIGMGGGYRGARLLDLCLAAIFHDLGKILIDSSILNKPGKLNTMENEVVRRHPQVSYDMLYNKRNIPERVRTAVLCHHENEDGSGYPNGLSGVDIHPFAKIIHVADVYDALSSRRPYKEACSFSESYEYLLGGCGTMFDKSVVEVFSKYVPIYPQGMQVELSNGQEALVVKNYRHNRLRPTVKRKDGTILDLQDERRNRNITILRQADEKALIAEGIAENEKGRGQKPRILVVDSRKHNQKDLKKILEESYEVSVLDSSEKVLEYLETETPDLILMDVFMPNKSGIETVREMKQRFPQQIPVIFVSAMNDIQTVMECKNIQAANYIVRPFEPSYLVQQVKAALK